MNSVNGPTKPSVIAWFTQGLYQVVIRYNSLRRFADGSISPAPDNVTIRGFGYQSYVPASCIGDASHVTLKGTGASGEAYITTVHASGLVEWSMAPLAGLPHSGQFYLPAKNVNLTAR